MHQSLRRLANMTLKTLGPKAAADLDAELMSEAGGFTIDQLMELAGLSVSQAVYKVHPPSKGKHILIACGPGNNGGDGLVAARHLHHYGYTPTVYYPKPTDRPIYKNLTKQLKNLSIKFTEDPISELPQTNLIVDALFGFSFKPPVREPFGPIVEALESGEIDVLSVDIPSSWDVEAGPPSPSPSASNGNDNNSDNRGGAGANFMPKYLISLTAPKPCVQHFNGEGRRHFVGGRFLPEKIAQKFGLDLPPYQGIDQIVEVDVGAKIEKL